MKTFKGGKRFPKRAFKTSVYTRRTFASIIDGAGYNFHEAKKLIMERGSYIPLPFLWKAASSRA